MIHPWNDQGNAQRLLTELRIDGMDRVRWVTAEKGGHWVLYHAGRWWTAGADTRMRAFARSAFETALEEEAQEYSDTPGANGAKSQRDKFVEFIRKSQSNSGINNAVSVAQTFEDWWAEPEEFDRDTHLLNFPNGTLDTRFLEFREHRPEDMLTKMMPAKYEPDAPCPKWMHFLELSQPDPAIRKYLQVAAGYTLTGRSDLKVMFYTYGPADTGKSVFCNTLRRGFGNDYGLTAAAGALRSRDNSGGPSEDIDIMAGKRYVTTSESRPGEPMDEALVKRLTGRDEQRTRSLHVNSRSWTPQMTIWIASNQYPKVSTDDDAIYERIRVIRFEREFKRDDPERDDQLEEKIREYELPGVVAWMAEGLRIFLREGMQEPAAVSIHSEEFKASSDGVLEFLAEGADDRWLGFGEDRTQQRQPLYDLYKDWCKEASGRQPLGRNRFYTRMASAGYGEARDERKRRVFSGLSVITEPSWRESKYRPW